MVHKVELVAIRARAERVVSDELPIGGFNLRRVCKGRPPGLILRVRKIEPLFAPHLYKLSFTEYQELHFFAGTSYVRCGAAGLKLNF